jgi:hypothetical protein
MTPKESFERWLRFQREAQLAGVHNRPFSVTSTKDDAQRFDMPTVTLEREHVLQLRADHYLLLNVVADLLGFDDIKRMSVGEVCERMVERAWAHQRRLQESVPPTAFGVGDRVQEDVGSELDPTIEVR